MNGRTVKRSMDKWLARIAPDCTDNVAVIAPTLESVARAADCYRANNLSAALVDACGVSDVHPDCYPRVRKLVRAGGVLAVRGTEDNSARDKLYTAVGYGDRRRGWRVFRRDGNVEWTRICHLKGASHIARRDVPLGQYVAWIKDGDRCAFTRWGDSSWDCVLGTNCQGVRFQKWTPELRMDLRRALHEYHDDPNYVMAMPAKSHFIRRVAYWELVAAYIREHDGLDKIQWAGTHTFIVADHKGKLWPFIEAVRKCKVILVVSSRYTGLTQHVFPGAELVIIPQGNCHADLERIEGEILGHEFPAAVLISAGPATNVIIHDLYDKAPGFYFNMGSIWGPYVGRIEHTCQRAITPEIIERNLGNEK
jgi:hypothetical protein